MKKISIIAAAAILAVLTIACSKVDNPVSTESGQVTVMTNNRAIYDQLGVTDQIQVFLDRGSHVTTDTVLIYDSNGRLVAKQGIEATTMKDLTFRFDNLPNGQYTLIYWQTAKDIEGEPWNVFGEESLSTVRLLTTLTAYGVTCALGYASQEFTINGDHRIVSFVPRAMCSAVTNKLDYAIEDKGFKELYACISPEQSPNGVYLNPALSDEGRLIYSDSEPYASYIAGAEPDTCFTSLITLAHGDNLSLYVYSVNADDVPEIFFISKHQKLTLGENHAFYFDLDRASWQPPFVGPQEAFDAWKADRDAGILVANPLMKWGCNIEDVWAYMQTRSGWNNSLYGDNLTPGSGESSWLYAVFPADCLMEMYNFKQEGGKDLKSVTIASMDPNVPVEVAKKHLQALNYNYITSSESSTEDAVDLYMSSDNMIYCGLMEVPSEGWMMVFRDATTLESSARRSPVVQSVRESYLDVFQKLYRK